MLATAVELNEKAACPAIVVTALTQRARGWWERLGFHRFDPDEPDQLDLYLLTSEIDATLRRLAVADVQQAATCVRANRV